VQGTTELGIVIFADFSTATLLYPEQSEDVQELDKVQQFPERDKTQ
jgi:hypothetical protein